MITRDMRSAASQTRSSLQVYENDGLWSPVVHSLPPSPRTGGVVSLTEVEKVVITPSHIQIFCCHKVTAGVSKTSKFIIDNN